MTNKEEVYHYDLFIFNQSSYHAYFPLPIHPHHSKRFHVLIDNGKISWSYYFNYVKIKNTPNGENYMNDFPKQSKYEKKMSNIFLLLTLSSSLVVVVGFMIICKQRHKKSCGFLMNRKSKSSIRSLLNLNTETYTPSKHLLLASTHVIYSIALGSLLSFETLLVFARLFCMESAYPIKGISEKNFFQKNDNQLLECEILNAKNEKNSVINKEKLLLESLFYGNKCVGSSNKHQRLINQNEDNGELSIQKTFYGLNDNYENEDKKKSKKSDLLCQQNVEKFIENVNTHMITSLQNSIVSKLYYYFLENLSGSEKNILKQNKYNIMKKNLSMFNLFQDDKLVTMKKFSVISKLEKLLKNYLSSSKTDAASMKQELNFFSRYLQKAENNFQFLIKNVESIFENIWLISNTTDVNMQRPSLVSSFFPNRVFFRREKFLLSK